MTMRDLAIYGAGGFGRETALMIEQINISEKRWNVVGFFDDKIKKGSVVDGLPILGGLAEVKRMSSPAALVVAIADPRQRVSVVDQLKNFSIDYPALIHPQAMIGSAANHIGKGSIITAGCILTTGIQIAEFCIINLSVTIGHDVRIGDYCTVMPGCNISGNVCIGKSTMIGTGVKILQNLSVGANARVGAGAVVINNFGDAVTLVGIPATQIK
jgi:sugar O-acyltransferase (sialic acid O-acetyltransferase NeuD family)